VEFRKNISAVIDALALIPSEDIHYVIAGRITLYKALLDRKIQLLGLTGRVHFLGEVSQQELYDLYLKSLMAIYPSLMEGFGIPVLEAIALKKPVITNKGGCFEEVGGTIAWYSDTTNPNSIAAVIQEIIDHPEKVMDKQKDTETHLHQFSASVILSQLLACYTEDNQA
jgi:glycosyltransferase involved in cell wall biosynthesis